MKEMRLGDEKKEREREKYAVLCAVRDAHALGTNIPYKYQK
jgi:hypothetical protein